VISVVVGPEANATPGCVAGMEGVAFASQPAGVLIPVDLQARRCCP
jgi:hypothetical protein